VYHGTTKTAAESIKREGLKPNLQDAFKLWRTDYLTEVRKRPYAYVTTDKAMAEAFARFRAAYERATEGTTIYWRGTDSEAKQQAEGIDPAEFVKMTADRQPYAEPALVEIDLPDTWKNSFKPDPAGPDSHGLVYPDTIPAEYVAKIEPLRLND
jgi:hypothetical protein